MKRAAVCCCIKIFRLTWDFYITTVHTDVYTVKTLTFTIYTSQLPVWVEATAGEPETLQVASSSDRTRFPNSSPVICLKGKNGAKFSLLRLSGILHCSNRDRSMQNRLPVLFFSAGV